MSAIVEGVSMARHCGECELNKLNWDRCHQILRGCPIIGEIPTPHGRLIDADKFLKDNAAIADKSLINLLCRGTLRNLIDNAPTIIEAEVSE